MVKLSLCLIKYHAMKPYHLIYAARNGDVCGRVEVQLGASLTSAPDGVSGQLHAPATLPPGERAPGTLWIEGWVGPRAVWTRWQREKSLSRFFTGK